MQISVRLNVDFLMNAPSISYVIGLDESSCVRHGLFELNSEVALEPV